MKCGCDDPSMPCAISSIHVDNRDVPIFQTTVYE